MLPQLTLFQFYVDKFFVPSNFNLHRHSIYAAIFFFFFGINCNVNRGITLNSYDFFKFFNLILKNENNS